MYATVDTYPTASTLIQVYRLIRGLRKNLRHDNLSTTSIEYMGTIVGNDGSLQVRTGIVLCLLQDSVFIHNKLL
jgi:hypothetical protein